MAGVSLYPEGHPVARISDIALKSGAVVTMHTRLSYQEARDLPRKREQIRKVKDEDLRDFKGLCLFVTGWAGLRDVETGEELPFEAASLPRADFVDIADIWGLIDKISNGEDPNASSESSPAI
jgi:hypothetical protein